MIQIQKIDSFIIILMFAALPIDMLNGMLLTNKIFFPISVAQLHKLLIIFFLFFRLFFRPQKLFLSIILIFLLFIPSIYQVFSQRSISFIFPDIIKIMRYLMPMLSFLFFSDTIKYNNNIDYLYSLIKFSYIFLVANIFGKYIGFGYPMYEYGDIGSRGFFYAGNEVSALLIILSSIIAFKIWKDKRKIKYFLFFVLNIIVGVAISSKTGILGIILVFSLITINISLKKISLKKIKYFILSIFFIFPIITIYLWEFIQKNAVYVRLKYFWNKLDFWTFILSNRNNFFDRAYNAYTSQYNLLEKIIGVGQSKYEFLNKGKIVEIDIVDIFFAYGFIGLFLFIFIFLYLYMQIKKNIQSEKYSHSNFVLLMLFILLGISIMAGHVFSSGMSAIFIGAIFSLMYLKK